MFRFTQHDRWPNLDILLYLMDFFQLTGALEQKAGISSASSVVHLRGAAVGIVAWLLLRKAKMLAEVSRV
jgi:hypothetical protein